MLLFLSFLIKTCGLIYFFISVVKITFQTRTLCGSCWSSIIVEVYCFFCNWSVLSVVSLFKNLRWQLILSHSISIHITTINWLLKPCLIIPRSIWSHLKFLTTIVPPIILSFLFKIFIFMCQNIWLKLSSFSCFAIFFISCG